jgi:hypothetical protein
LSAEVQYIVEPGSGTTAAQVACPCGPGFRFHALNCPVRPGEYMAEYVERLETRMAEIRGLAR